MFEARVHQHELLTRHPPKKPLHITSLAAGRYPNGMRSPPSADFLASSCHLHQPSQPQPIIPNEQVLKKTSKRLQSHVLSTVNKMRTNPSTNLFGFGPMLAIRLLWTGPQSLQANSPRPHSLYPRGGWSFQRSLARCIRNKPQILAAGYLIGFHRAKKNKPILILPQKSFEVSF